MTDWNYNMDQAPKSVYGEIETGRYNKIGEAIMKPHLFINRIIAAAVEEDLVTISYWLPREYRWCMFAKGQVPLCWKPWPEYPGLVE
jgi:hypothetical protein